MDLASYRRKQKLSQAGLASLLGITSRSYICGIEKNARRPSLELALRIERLSNGAVTAASLNPIAAEIGAATERAPKARAA